MNQPTEELVTTSKRILYRVKQILKHQEEIAVLKGENFNIFSILKMESRENDTHSAFLGELLNPKGSHYFGNTFLKLFLNQIGNEKLDADTANVMLEYAIGTNDHENLTGGRVDIYIKDDAGNTVCIENKIYAIDQPNQLKRYANHNKSKNKVYYLTLNGDDASDGSKNDLLIDINYSCLSYHTTIIEWLEACCKEATDQPIIRESIKQYIILLKKLTNQLSDTKMEKEIKDLTIANYKAAKTISSNIEAVELEYTRKFLGEIKEVLNNKLNPTEELFSIVIDDDLNKAWSRLRITHKKWPQNTCIQLQGNSKIPWSNSGYGLVTHKSSVHRSDIENKLKNYDFFKTDFKSNEHWPFYQLILFFGNTEERAKLFDRNQRSELVTVISNKLIKISNVCKNPLSEINNVKK